MNKRIQRLARIYFGMVLSLGTLSTYALTQGDYTYTVTAGTATITDFNSSYSGALSVTNTLGGYPVTDIGDSAFAYCYRLTDVVIPAGVKKIGNSAFWSCSRMLNVTIPGGVTNIDNYAFQSCYCMTNLIIPGSVISIGSSAFSGCSRLPGMSIPFGVIRIGGAAFYGCYSLDSVTIPSSVISIGGSAFANCVALDKVTIPDSVISIGDYAFQRCSGLASVTFGKSVTSIGSFAFQGCTNLIAIVAAVDNSVYSSLEGSLFNKSQTSIIQYPTGKSGSYTIPNSVTNIGRHACYDCSGLTRVTIPDSVTSIGQQAFSFCNGLTDVTIPESVTNMHYTAFLGSGALTAIVVNASNPFFSSADGVLFNKNKTLIIQCPAGKSGSCMIPSSVTGIESSAFSYMSNLTAIAVALDNPVYSSEGGVLFDKNKTTFVQYPGGRTGSYTIPGFVTSIGNFAFQTCRGLTSVCIPDSVTSIGEYAFSQCSGLTNVTVGNNVVLIRYCAFYYCSNLTAIYFKGNAPSLGTDVFSGTASATVYHLPTSADWPSVPNVWGGRPTALWIGSITVTFDATGGTVSPGSTNVSYLSSYGALPTPSKTGCSFSGWHTNSVFTGAAVTSTTTVTIASDHTLFAKWIGQETTSTPVPVPYSWLNQYPTLINMGGGNCEVAALIDADLDGMLSWQEYVAGSVPTNRDSVFRSLISASNGTSWVTWSPDLGTARVYTVESKTNLNEAVWRPANDGCRFFRVKVGMP